MKSAAHGQPDNPPRAGLLKQAAGAIKALVGARDHDLARGVEIGGYDLAGFAADPNYGWVVEAENGSHPRAYRCRGCHCPATSVDGCERIERSERAGRHQPSELTKAVSGYGRRNCSSMLEKGQQCQAVEKDRGLRPVGCLQCRGGALGKNLSKGHPQAFLGGQKERL
jgi:hypothetical protein